MFSRFQSRGLPGFLRFGLARHRDTNHHAATTSCSADMLSRATSSCIVDKYHAWKMYSTCACIRAGISSEDLVVAQSRILDNKSWLPFLFFLNVSREDFDNFNRDRYRTPALSVNKNPIRFAFDQNFAIRFAGEFIFAR